MANTNDRNMIEQRIFDLINDEDSFIHKNDGVLAACQKMMEDINGGDDDNDLDTIYPLRIEPKIDNALYVAQFGRVDSQIFMEVTLLHINPNDEGEWIGQVITQSPLLPGDNHVRLAKFFAMAISEAKKNLDNYDPHNVV